MHHASASAGLRDSTVPRGAASHARPPTPERNLRRAAPRGRAPPAAPTKRQRREVDVLLAWYAHPNQSHVCARTDWYVRVVGQPQVLRNQPGRWPPSPGMTRRSSRSRCRRSWGSMPVSFEPARLVDASPTARRRAEPRTAARGFCGTAGAPAAARARRTGGLACDRGGDDTRVPPPSPGRGTAAARHTPHAARTPRCGVRARGAPERDSIASRSSDMTPHPSQRRFSIGVHDVHVLLP